MFIRVIGNRIFQDESASVNKTYKKKIESFVLNRPYSLVIEIDSTFQTMANGFSTDLQAKAFLDRIISLEKELKKKKKSLKKENIQEDQSLLSENSNMNYLENFFES